MLVCIHGLGLAAGEGVAIYEPVSLLRVNLALRL